MIAPTIEIARTLGNAVPPYTQHAISVQLPTWRDNVGYEEGEKRVIDSMETGYPRFFIHKSIQKLASICERKFASAGERAILFPSKRTAELCREFMVDRAEKETNSNISVRLVLLQLCPDDASPSNKAGCLDLHIVLFPESSFSLAKQFWQHTGMGISSRLAEKCLAELPDVQQSPTLPSASPPRSRTLVKAHNRHYSVRSPSPPKAIEPITPARVDDLTEDHVAYLEERYGRNLPRDSAAEAKRALRRRIADVLAHDSESCVQLSGGDDARLKPSSRGVESITEDDVFLYPCGMAAIWAAHQLSLKARPPTKSVCFGFPYTDTLKILQKWGPGCHFFGHGLDSDIDDLESLLASESLAVSNADTLPILALFTEFPSNPLLRSPNLPRLRALADKYEFLIVVDETIGNFVNTSVLPYADIVVSSLTKVFSGDSNVMGGSLVLNPRGKFYDSLKSVLKATYEDIYFEEDAIFMERNSRFFKKRVKVINHNAEAVCDFLQSRQYSPEATSNISNKNFVVKEVFYPKFTTRANYDMCRAVDLEEGEPNFGGLFSVTFTTLEASREFFDNLNCHKGPSLGTAFTLACPYTILAHYGELGWASEYGVEEGLVRVSVGTEDKETLLQIFGAALKAAEDTELRSS